MLKELRFLKKKNHKKSKHIYIYVYLKYSGVIRYYKRKYANRTIQKSRHIHTNRKNLNGLPLCHEWVVSSDALYNRRFVRNVKKTLDTQQDKLTPRFPNSLLSDFSF